MAVVLLFQGNSKYYENLVKFSETVKFFEGKQDVCKDGLLEKIFSEAADRAKRHLTDILQADEFNKYMGCKNFER